MRRRIGRWQALAALALTGGFMSNAGAQTATISATTPDGSPRGFKEAPGFYGTSFGHPSYGTVRASSSFSSPYGLGYGYGHPPSAILPGPYGMGIWRPESNAPYYVYGASSYRTFAIPYERQPKRLVVTPPFGVYSPAIGPKP